MKQDLFQHIHLTPLADTHEHLETEVKFIKEGPDVLQDLFDNYPSTDLIIAGASLDAVKRLVDSRDEDIEGRWEGVKHAWQHCQFTGYGEAVSILAKEIYAIDEITTSALVGALQINLNYRKPGGQLQLLKEIGNIDHVQIDDFIWACLPNPTAPEFYFYDINWALHSSGMIDLEALCQETRIEVVDLKTLLKSYETIFSKYGKVAIAVKSQHAYNRSLLWHERDDADAEKVLQKQLHKIPLSEKERLCLGDWSLARALEFAEAYDLPMKVHTGLLYDHGVMNINHVRPSHLSSLLMQYPKVNFVLMHTGYPFGQEIIGLAKHFPNVFIDLCWAWTIDPYNTVDFLRHVNHAIPTNKLFAFGGDCHWPAQAVAYAKQARNWLAYALNAEIEDGFLNEQQAMSIATKYMCENQRMFFKLEQKRA
jgi:predicted TIM-barrel fold metal-dependent hydrolase